jgi:hypothetical protein
MMTPVLGPKVEGTFLAEMPRKNERHQCDAKGSLSRYFRSIGQSIGRRLIALQQSINGRDCLTHRHEFKRQRDGKFELNVDGNTHLV